MPTGGRPRGFDPDAALDAAVETFWRRGYDGAGLGELTERMGISRPALYRFFGDKAQLFDAALDRYIQSNMGYVREALALPTAHDVAEAFLIGNARAVTMPGRPHGCLSVQAAVTDDADAFASLRDNRRAIQELLTERFSRSIAEGDLGPHEDADEIARFLITVATGFAIRAADGESRDALLALARRSAATVPASPHPPRKA